MKTKAKLADRRLQMGWKPKYDEDRKSGKDDDVPDYAMLSSAFPLDILRGHRKITGKQYDAAKLFEERYARFKWPHAQGAGWARQVKSEFPEGSDPPMNRNPPSERSDMLSEANFAAMVKALEQYPEATELLRRYAVFHEHDYYIQAIYKNERAGNASVRRTALLCQALDVLDSLDRVSCDPDETIPNALGINHKHETLPAKVA
jgi:hypothetical protein